MSSLVSVIMPAYNAERYIEEAIQSVLSQTYQNWELLIINDGSVDNTEEKIKSFTDERIKYFKKENGGVSSARNLGLQNMKGDYFCFLDADDTYYERSLSSRLKVFQKDTNIVFVDGKSRVYDDTGEIIRVYTPTFKGNPINELLSLSEACFFGQTWMVKVIDGVVYQFKKGQTHSEDLTFFLTIAHLGAYSFVDEFILAYRTGHSSTMANLKGLEKGYFLYLKEAKKIFKDKKIKLIELRFRIVKIMFLSYLADNDYKGAVKVLIRLLK